MLKVPLVYEFRELKRGKARPSIRDQLIWHFKSATSGHQTPDHRLVGDPLGSDLSLEVILPGGNLYEVTSRVRPDCKQISAATLTRGRGGTLC